MSRLKDKLTAIVCSLIFIALLCAFLYPNISDILIIKNSPGYVELIEEDIDLKISKHSNKEIVIKSISDLRKGDIVFRRYVTKDNHYLSRIFNTYFTHTVVYAGDQYFYEASNKRHSKDEVAVNLATNTDFSDKDFMKMEKVVVFRPKFDLDNINKFSAQLETVATDDRYIFKTRNKLSDKNKDIYEYKIMCTTYITDQLYKLGFVDSLPHIISPDYLFQTLIEKPEYFELIEVKWGY